MKQARIPATRFIMNMVVISVLLFGQACTSITEKFTGTEREEIAPFAQKTVEVLVVENIQIRDNELIHLRRFVDDTFVELDELQRHMEKVELYRDKLVEYSIDLVRLTDLYEKESERIAAYASHLEQMVGMTELNRLGISEADWTDILADIRSQDTFLDALRTFQPVINTASRDFGVLITRIETELLVAVRRGFDRRIEAHYMEVNEFLLIQHNTRKELLAAMIALDKYRRGDSEAIAGFRQKNFPISKIFSSNTPSERQLAILEKDIRERIRQSTMLIAELEPDYTNYVNARTELDQKEVEIFGALTIARLQVETWTQAHQALANGVKETGDLMQLTMDAAGLF